MIDWGLDTDHRYNSLDDGYKFICGPRGNKLSGGQKQRIAIARAVIRQPAVLIFDEATSALDESSQVIVQECINNVMHRTTTILIAHRLSTLSNWDKIVVIREGRVIQEGSYHNIIKSN